MKIRSLLLAVLGLVVLAGSAAPADAQYHHRYYHHHYYHHHYYHHHYHRHY